MDRTNGHDQEPITRPPEPPAPPGGGNGRDVFGALLTIMKSLGRVEAKQESLEKKIDSMPDVRPDIARLEERSRVVRNVGVGILVGVALLMLHDCGVLERGRPASAPPAAERPAPTPEQPADPL